MNYCDSKRITLKNAISFKFNFLHGYSVLKETIGSEWRDIGLPTVGLRQSEIRHMGHPIGRRSSFSVNLRQDA